MYATNPHAGFVFYKNKIPLVDFVVHEPTPEAVEKQIRKTIIDLCLE